MPVRPCALTIDAHHYEQDRRGTPMFPCGGYVTQIGDGATRSIPWHWHEEIEVLVVCSGTLRLELAGQSYIIKCGEGAFINSNVLQSAVPISEETCEIQSLVFHSSLLSGNVESIFEQRYVRPLLGSSALAGIHFSKQDAWHRHAVDCILKAFDAYRDEAFGYELIVREKLSHLLYLIVTQHRASLTEQQDSNHPDVLRAKEMLSFIHIHYAEPLELHDIARAASVSERESLRCFKRTLGTTPMKYLLEHRISVAAGLLADSSLNITEICRQTGFASPSYFSLAFKKSVGMTPSEYRK